MPYENSEWEQAEPIFRERAYRSLAAQPEYLLEGDGGPIGLKADAVFARLTGFDDEIVKDGYRLSRVEPELRVPMRPRLQAWSEPAASAALLRVARYVLQSGWATLSVSVPYLPPGVEPDVTGQAVLAFLRYRRRE
jgi:hypothetical protein